MKNTVYIVQEPQRRDRITGEFVPAFDLTPASIYGDLKVILPPGNSMLSTAPMVAKLKYELRNFNDDDYLLAVGDPAAMTAAAAIAAKNNRGKYVLLKWDREARSYITLRIEI